MEPLWRTFTGNTSSVRVLHFTMLTFFESTHLTVLWQWLVLHGRRFVLLREIRLTIRGYLPPGIEVGNGMGLYDLPVCAERHTDRSHLTTEPLNIPAITQIWKAYDGRALEWT